jgi:hypothetical protein
MSCLSLDKSVSPFIRDANINYSNQCTRKLRAGKTIELLKGDRIPLPMRAERSLYVLRDRNIKKMEVALDVDLVLKRISKNFEGSGAIKGKTLTVNDTGKGYHIFLATTKKEEKSRFYNPY